MKYLRKAWVQILIAMVVCAFLGELIYGQTIGYGTVGRTTFNSGLFLEGEIEYKVDNLDVIGGSWEANFYNLSSVYIGFYDDIDGFFREVINTSKLTIKPVASSENRPYLEFKKIINNSILTSVTFEDEKPYVHLTWSEDRITGIMKNTTEEDDLDFSYSYMFTDNRTIDATLSRVRYYLTGINEYITFEISLGKPNLVRTFPEVGDNIGLKGDLHAFSNSGSVWCDGQYIHYRNFVLSGDLEIEVLRVPDPFRDDNQLEYKWKLDIKGDADITKGYGFPFWSIGLMLSPISAVFIIALHHFKKIWEEKKENDDNYKNPKSS